MTPLISVDPTVSKGRGVFAREHIAAGSLIEEAPVIVIRNTQIDLLERTVLGEYYFRWGADEPEGAILLGTCQLCNHSFDPNAIFVIHPERQTIAFLARRHISPGEEITTNYHGHPDTEGPLWFAVTQ